MSGIIYNVPHNSGYPDKGKHRGSSVLYNFRYYLIYLRAAGINSVCLRILLASQRQLCVSPILIASSLGVDGSGVEGIVVDRPFGRMPYLQWTPYYLCARISYYSSFLQEP